VIHTKARITLLDVVLGAAIAAGAVFFALRVTQDLHYNWKWHLIPQYLVRYDAETGRWVANYLLKGFFTTIRLSVWAMLLATVVGTLMGLARTSRAPFRRMLGATYVELIRNTPPLVLIFIFYFFVSDQIMPLLGVQAFADRVEGGTRTVVELLFSQPSMLPGFLSALVTLSLFEGAYITEIVRSGVQSIERGQWEASAALGFTRLEQLRYVILPQAVVRILPPLAGQFISIIKDSAIVSVISIQELTFQGMELMAATYMTFEIWITVSVLYLCLTLCCSLAVERLEAVLGRYRRG
jgi:polar amino acid transport system permease protein